MGIKTSAAETVANIASARLSSSLGLGTFIAGVWNSMGIEGMTINEFAILAGAIVTIFTGIVTGYVKLSDSRARKRIYALAEQHYLKTGRFPEEIFNVDEKEGSNSV